MKNIKELPPNMFQFGNRGCDIPFYIYVDVYKNVARYIYANYNVIGYSKNPEYSKRIDCYGLMLEHKEDLWEGWEHINIEIIKELDNLLN